MLALDSSTFGFHSIENSDTSCFTNCSSNLCVIPKQLSYFLVRSACFGSQSECDVPQKLSNSKYCKYCSESFKFEFQLWAHMKKEHSEKTQLLCSECDSKSASINQLENHFRECHPGFKPFACDLCSYCASIKQRLDRHKQTVHTEGNTLLQFQCSDCPKRVMAYSELIRHIKTHNEKKVFSCDLCSNSYKRPWHLKRHKTGVHFGMSPLSTGKKILRADRMHQCSICGYSTSVKSALQNHFKTQHTMERPFICNLCSKSFKLATYLKMHMKLSHFAERRFPCDQCEYKAVTAQNLSSHNKAAHSEETPFPCNICPKRFKCPKLLKRHVDKHLNHRPFSCHMCSYSATTKHMLDMHLNTTHSEAKPLPCMLCGKMFKSRQGLVYHMNTHTFGDEKRFSCGQCTFRTNLESSLRKHTENLHSVNKCFECHLCKRRFGTFASLKNHMITHQDENPFACGLCSFRTKHRTGLARHNITVHSTETPFPCKVCEKRFKLEYSLKHHMKTHSDEKEYSCNQCVFETKYKACLNVHMQKVHSDEKPHKCALCDKKYALTVDLKKHVKTKHEAQM